MEFRALTADEIDCRVATVSEKGCSLLLYKDARADMVILDETVGPENWQRRHTRDNANCIVSIWSEARGQWIEKEDTGTESFTEKEKGLASDSFKRACVNWGIGRELYTAPFIWVSAQDCNVFKRNDGKFSTNDRFEVVEITVDNKQITALAIKNSKTGAVVYTYGKVKAKKAKAKADNYKPAIETPCKCPNCGKEVTPITRKDGSIAMPADILSGCGGVCFECYKAGKGIMTPPEKIGDTK